MQTRLGELMTQAILEYVQALELSRQHYPTLPRSKRSLAGARFINVNVSGGLPFGIRRQREDREVTITGTNKDNTSLRCVCNFRRYPRDLTAKWSLRGVKLTIRNEGGLGTEFTYTQNESGDRYFAENIIE